MVLDKYKKHVLKLKQKLFNSKHFTIPHSNYSVITRSANMINCGCDPDTYRIENDSNIIIFDIKITTNYHNINQQTICGEALTHAT
jgi:hypothetical protein